MAKRTSRPGVRRPKSSATVNYHEVCSLARELPGVQESTSYGLPSLKVGGKFMAGLRKDGETLALRMDFPDRARLLETEPDVFFITDHYVNYRAVVVRLNVIRYGRLAEVLEQAWRQVAPKRLIATLDTDRG